MGYDVIHDNLEISLENSSMIKLRYKVLKIHQYQVDIVGGIGEDLTCSIL